MYVLILYISTIKIIIYWGSTFNSYFCTGFHWLLSEISDDFPNLSERVEREYGEQKRKEAEDRARRREAVRKIREERWESEATNSYV